MRPAAASLQLPVTRRGLLAAGALVVGAATLGLDGAVRAAGSASLRRADFERAIGTRGKLLVADGPSVPVLVTGTADLPAGAGDPQASFAALFSTTADEAPPQGTFTLIHDQLGRVELFLVPGPPGPGPTTYEAIFNRPQLGGAR